jgi:hypothetical protein
MMRILAAVLAALLAAGPAHAGNSLAGTLGSRFLKRGAGARAGAMAEAFTAVADDAYAAYYNPAGLAQLTGTQLAGAHTASFQGINYEVLDFAYPFGKQDSHHALALGIYHLSVDDIERRVGDSTDAVGTFGASDGAYALSYAYAIQPRLSLGVTGKYILQTLDSYRASAFAADVGALYHAAPKARRPIRLAAVIKNMGTKPSYVKGQEGDPLPMAVTLGGSIDAVPHRLRLNLDMTKYRDTRFFAAAGGEYMHPLADNVMTALRFGYSTQRSDLEGFRAMTFGAGFSFHKARFDFAWVPFGNLGDTFRYSLLVKF